MGANQNSTLCKRHCRAPSQLLPISADAKEGQSVLSFATLAACPVWLSLTPGLRGCCVRGIRLRRYVAAGLNLAPLWRKHNPHPPTNARPTTAAAARGEHAGTQAQ